MPKHRNVGLQTIDKMWVAYLDSQALDPGFVVELCELSHQSLHISAGNLVNSSGSTDFLHSPGTSRRLLYVCCQGNGVSWR